ncbi:MAG: SMC-Scp complex subunit ScpB [Bacteriovoracaceae bacterium]
MSEAQPEVKTEIVPEATADAVVVSTELKNIIEALIFASDEPMTTRFIRSIMDDVNKDLPPSGHFVVNAEIIRKAVGDLNRGYGKMGSGFRIIEIAGGFTYATQDNFSSWVGKLAKEKARRRLSPTAVETLAIIAYKQPIAKGEVEFIRGVNVDYIINALLEKDLIHITGRANTPGRPLLYGTTQKFLEHFGLNDLSDLPKPREISELINETELEVDRRLLAEQQELEFKEDLEKKLEGNEGSKNKPQKASKSKAEENIKEENRRSAQQGETAGGAPVQTDDKAADGQRTAEGETPSESNLTTDEATAETGVNIPEILPVHQPENLVENEQEYSETGVLENPEVPQEPSEENLALRTEQPEQAVREDELVKQTIDVQVASITDVPEHPQNAEQDHLTKDDLEVSVIEEQETVTTDIQEIPVIEEREEFTTIAPENLVNEEQDRLEINAKEVFETVPTEQIGTEPAAPVPPLEGKLNPVSMEEAAVHLESSIGDEQSVLGDLQKNPQESETGWSKWKNKVKTFFQKLFA